MRVLALSHASCAPTTCRPPAYATTNTPSAAAPPMPPASIVQKFAGKHIHKANMQAAGASSDADGDADQAQWFDKAQKIN